METKIICPTCQSKNCFESTDKDGEYYTTMLDVENAEEFESTEFLKACNAMGITEKDL